MLCRVQIKRRTCPEEVPDGFFCVMRNVLGRGDGLRQSNIPRFLVQNIPMNLRKAEKETLHI